MVKVIQSQTTKKLTICLVINIILVVVLYLLPIDNNKLKLCIYKIITGKECFNCGMTRAFLSTIHLQFSDAVAYNKNVIVVFPLTVILYMNFWLRYIFINKEEKE